MDALIFILTLVACGFSVASAVVSAWFARKSNVREIENDVDELMAVVDKIGRTTRRETMRRVRAAATEVDYPVPPGATVPTAQTPVTDLKSALRRQVFGGKSQ